VKKVGADEWAEHPCHERDWGRPLGGQHKAAHGGRARRYERGKGNAAVRHRLGHVVAQRHVDNKGRQGGGQHGGRLRGQPGPLVAGQGGGNKTAPHVDRNHRVGAALNGTGEQAMEAQQLIRQVLNHLCPFDSRDGHVDHASQKDAEGGEKRACGAESELAQCGEQGIGQDEGKKQDSPKNEQ